MRQQFKDEDAVWVNPNDYPDSRLNKAPALEKREYDTLKAEIERDGQLKPGFAWRGETIAGKHRRKIAIDLGRKFKVILLPDSLTIAQVKQRIVRDNLVGRKWTIEKMADFVWAEYGQDVVAKIRRGHKMQLPDGSYGNPVVWLCNETTVSERTMARILKIIYNTHMRKEPVKARVEWAEDNAAYIKERAREYKLLSREKQKIERQKERFENKLDELDKKLRKLEVEMLGALTISKGPRPEKIKLTLRLLEKAK